MAHDARAVANKFVELGNRDDVVIDHLKLQKLVYFCHGWHLAVTDHPLFRQKVLAWPYGPVVREVYDHFRTNGRGPITTLALDIARGKPYLPFETEYSDLTAAVIDKVWSVYKGYTGLELSAMAHDKGTPWHQMVGHLKPKEIRDVEIPNEVIRKHYKELVQTRRGVRRTLPR